MSDEIRINTDSLRSYAGQLDSIQRQIYALNAEIRSFRYHTGKLWNVNTYGYEWTINPAKSYCVDTANEFESIERYLQGCDPEMYEGNTGWFSAVDEKSVNSLGQEIFDTVRDKVNGVTISIKNETQGEKLVKDLVEDVPFFGGGIKVVHGFFDTGWQEKKTQAGKISTFTSSMTGIIGDTLSLISDSGETVDKHIKLLNEGTKNGWTRWKSILTERKVVEGITKNSKIVDKIEGTFKNTFKDSFTKMFKPEKTVWGGVECAAKWVGVVSDFTSTLGDDIDKYGKGGIVVSAGKTVLKQTWSTAVKAGVAGVLALTPVGGSALAVGVAATVVSWGIDYGINKLSDGKYEDMGDFISKNVDDGVDAIVDTYKAAKKVASKGVEAAKGIVKNAKKSVANWWKNTKSSLSFAF